MSTVPSREKIGAVEGGKRTREDREALASMEKADTRCLLETVNKIHWLKCRSYTDVNESIIEETLSSTLSVSFRASYIRILPQTGYPSGANTKEQHAVATNRRYNITYYKRLGADSVHHPDLITGRNQISSRVDAKTGAVTCAHQYKEVAEENIHKMRSLLEIPRVQVLVAHNIV
ncbi:uncharacterized protein BJ212DRAFT_1587366 [Suillus subaureus]|uniref:Uncharacterized protein n=1 Tax=Suillus subaureus TaxID=48587 RepID=A0A9P7EBV1_9AGAM|nr:uncharacterized protein BJ212DRAFT_1587366 [Suillus subaureus]KAG1817156.1 hypothetical protein BJ212DRAFT_1587366 [Suillus subaureus]